MQQQIIITSKKVGIIAWPENSRGLWKIYLYQLKDLKWVNDYKTHV